MTKYKEFRGSLGSYKWERTEDGSYTLFSEYFNENCHSLSGAVEETLYNYILGTNIPQIIEKNSKVSIFEVGLGTALGLKITYDFISKHSPENILNFTSCELDKELAHQSLLILQEEGIIDEINWSERHQFFSGRFAFDKLNESSSWLVIIGDIRNRLEAWIQSPYFQKVDCIYQDAFSPKRSPTLWTYQWFSQLTQIAHSNTVMSTYSSTKAVWKAMVKAGWSVEKVKGHGAKKISTRAFYDKREMSAEILELMRRSPIKALSDDSP